MIPNLLYRLRRSCRNLPTDILQSRVNQKCIHFTVQAIFVFATMFLLFTDLYSETYVWQVTTLASMVQPIHRKTCPLPQPKVTPQDLKHRSLQGLSDLKHKHNQTNHLRSGSHVKVNATKSSVASSSSTSPPSTVKSSLSSSNARVGLLMLYSNSDGNWGNELMERVIRNRDDYAARHKYTVVTANDLLDKTRPAAWSKLKAMDHYLHNFDYLMYIDMDVVIMNPTAPLSVFIDMAPDADFIMTEDWNGVNTGIWLAKNTPFAHWFLQTAWNQTQLIPKKSKEGIAHPFEYEQRAFHFLLNTDIWQKRHLPHYRGDIEEIRKHFFLLPQCAFNSYIMHPMYWNGDREKSQYVDGDFLVHFAGKKGRVKTNLMKHYLDEAAKDT